MSLSRWSAVATKSAATGREALVVTMNSNKVNAMNPAWLDDFHSMLDHLETLPTQPVVLTAEGGSTFSAGLDLGFLFACSREESRERTFHVLDRLGEGILRWHALPHVTVAAISGHALAGGAVLSNASDFRVGYAGGKSHFGAIEVPVGVPFPPWAFITTKNATPVTLVNDAILFGRRFSHEECANYGMFRSLAPNRDALLDHAVGVATELSPGSMAAYALVKEQIVAEALQYCKAHGVRVMDQVMNTLYSDDGWAHIQAMLKAKIKKKH